MYPVGRFSELSELYPTAFALFQKTTQDESFNKITEPQFLINKVQFIIDEALQQQQVDVTQRQNPVNSISSEGKTETKTKRFKNFISSVASYFTPEQKIQDAHDKAANITDSDFLLCLKDLSSHLGPHQTRSVNTEKIAARWLVTRITELLETLHSQIQKDAITLHIQKKAASQEEKCSTVFIREIEAHSLSEPYSSVFLNDRFTFTSTEFSQLDASISSTPWSP